MNRKILHLPNWAHSAGGRKIELFQSLTEDPPLLFVGGVHGDEPEGVVLAKNLLEWLQKNNKEKFPAWALVPDLNPDGSEKNERTNGNGVDLNRNFPSSDWTNVVKAPRYNPGKVPGSEPETKALIGLIKKIRPQVIIHFHSWKPCVVYTGDSGAAWARTIAQGTGYEFRPDIGYPTPGSLGQFGWTTCQIPVVCVEAEEHMPLEKVWPLFSNGLMKLFTSRVDL